ncbi:hypothetical protein [Kordia sp.]|uniref:hypothetical protein n=1 Tax=Kordia sp. TaxID=1965332 RepID=UPI003D6B34AB
MNNEENYIPKSYITVSMVKEIMGEFTWPAPYEVYEGYDKDYVNIKFPICEIELYDVPENGVHLTFLTYNNGKELDATYKDIIYYNCIENYNPTEDIDFDMTVSSDRKVLTKRKVRNNLKSLHYYHMGFIDGTDYSWVKKYLERKE